MSRPNRYYDIELLPNFFLLAWMDDNGKTQHVDIVGRKSTITKIQHKKVIKLLTSKTVVGFNSINYDLPIVTAILEGFTVYEAYLLSGQIIDNGLRSWQVYSKIIRELINVHHIDLMEVAPTRAGLKLYGARIDAPKLWDSPTDWHADTTKRSRKILIDYCGNDLKLTKLLYDKLIPQLAIRAKMGAKYGINLMSKSDAQIAEAVIISEIGGGAKGIKVPNVRYVAPAWVKFKTKQLIELKQNICNESFTILGTTGKPQEPKWLKNTVIRLGEAQFNVGLGGLHSQESGLTVVSDKHNTMRNTDVDSYYPSIIINSQLRPPHLSSKFLYVYESIVKRRLRAKETGDKATADTLKIVINGSYGKFGSKYSKLYAPTLLLATTFTGQLALLMLIESLEMNFIPVVSANTDGIEALVPNDLTHVWDKLISDWEKTTGYKMSKAKYVSLHARDVNNYIAKYDNETIKAKGVFSEHGLSKNPQVPICFEAVREHIRVGKSMIETIRECTDVTQFLSSRQVNGGASWNDEHIGKVVRFYYSTNGSPMYTVKPNVHGTHNKVPLTDGCKPMLDLKKKLPKDLDYDYYIAYANRMLSELG